MLAVAIIVCGQELRHRIRLLALSDGAAKAAIHKSHCSMTDQRLSIALLHFFEQLDESDKADLCRHLFASFSENDLLKLADCVLAYMKEEALALGGKYRDESNRLPQSLIFHNASMTNGAWPGGQSIKLLVANTSQKATIQKG